jgi:hypothetical protein
MADPIRLHEAGYRERAFAKSWLAADLCVFGDLRFFEGAWRRALLDWCYDPHTDELLVLTEDMRTKRVKVEREGTESLEVLRAYGLDDAGCSPHVSEVIAHPLDRLTHALRSQAVEYAESPGPRVVDMPIGPLRIEPVVLGVVELKRRATPGPALDFPSEYPAGLAKASEDDALVEALRARGTQDGEPLATALAEILEADDARYESSEQWADAVVRAIERARDILRPRPPRSIIRE